MDRTTTEAQCPVPHASSQPLPPGHPPVPSHPESTLRPPTGERCIFFHTADESQPPTPTLSDQPTRAAELLAANVNPLQDGQGKSLDPSTTLVLASRNSQLALVQSSLVSRMLDAHFGSQSPAFLPSSPSSSSHLHAIRSRAAELHISSAMTFPITSMSTAGDHNLRSPLYVIGGEGRAIWTKELEVALAQGGVDAIVHSLKDLPTALPEGFMLGAVIEREDPRDALVIKNGLPYLTLDDLPVGSVIGTSSIRRVAQLRRKYPGLVFSDVRGNLNTRLSKLDSPTGPYTALVLAAAGLIRINLAHRITAFLSSPVLLYSVGQGSLGIEVRAPPPGASPETNRDAKILEIVRSIGDWRSTARAEAERSLLRELEGGCSIPVGVETTFEDHEHVEGRRNQDSVPLAGDHELGGTGKEGHSITRAGWEATIGTTPLANGAVGGSGYKATATRNPALAREVASSSSAATESGQTNGGVRPSMERYATAVNGETSTTSNGTSTASGAATSTPSLSDTYFPSLDTSSILSLLKPPEAYLQSNFSPPKQPIHLTLTATVVSLDGTRSASFSQTSRIQTIEEAQLLGNQVAKELRDVRGASVILKEVEIHRRKAEEVDERRRMERKRKAELELKKRRRFFEDRSVHRKGDGDGNVEEEVEVEGEGEGEEDGREENGFAADPSSDSRRKLEEVFLAVAGHAQNASTSLLKDSIIEGNETGGEGGRGGGRGGSLYPQEDAGEIDRRGVPRDDGQAKVWEV